MSGTYDTGRPYDTAGKSVEVYVPSTGQQCQLSDLPDGREDHTMEAKTICGGASKTTDTDLTCISLTSAGTWDKTTDLLEER